MLFASLLTLNLTTCLVALIVFLVVYMWTRRPDPRLPPFPKTPLPILGNILTLERNPRHQFEKWRKLCGDVFSLYIGTSYNVVVNGYEPMKELLVKRADNASDRPPLFYDMIIDTVDKGVLFSSGNNWKEQRSTLLSILRSFGMGKDRLAQKIHEEIGCYLERVADLGRKKEHADIKEVTYEAISNIICSIITGNRFGYEDQLFKVLLDKLRASISNAQGLSLVHVFPSLRYLPGDFFLAKKLKSDITDIMEQFAKKYLILKGVDEYDENNIDNLIAAYVFEKNKKEKSGQPTHLDERNLLKAIIDLFAAGSDTTSSSILWCVLYSVTHPDVQEKIYKEIVREIGPERRPNTGDKSKLTYLNAVINETLRLGNVVPLSLPHVCSSDIEYQGYIIPKGTQLVPNLYSVLYDKEIWGEDAEKFRPERFIDENGKLLNPPEFIPFSIGRRICLGEALAKMELFLFLSALFQRFKFLPKDPNNPPSLDSVNGFTANPQPFEVKLVDRLAH